MICLTKFVLLNALFNTNSHFSSYLVWWSIQFLPKIGAIVFVIVWQLNLQLPMPYITTNVVSLNPAKARCTRYNIYVIKFVSDLQQVGGFLWVL